MGGDTKLLHDILDTVVFIKDTAVTKEELDERLLLLEDRIERKFNQKFNLLRTELRDEIITHVDGFITLHKKLDTEYAALYYKYDRLESRVDRLEKSG